MLKVHAVVGMDAFGAKLLIPFLYMAYAGASAEELAASTLA